MLKEEGFHMGTGHMGLQRIAKAGRVPGPLFQKYINKWLSTAYDLFGKDNSSSAEWFYVWGLKGRYDEHRHAVDPDRETLKIDYDSDANPGLLIRDILDELVEVVPGAYLGKVLLRRGRDRRWALMGYFALEPAR